MGEPTHKYGMVKPRRNIGLITLAATTAGPIGSEPECEAPGMSDLTCPSGA